MRTQLVTVVLLMLASFPSYAQWRERRAALTQMHQAGEFRIFYSLSGTDALPYREDSDRNGIPDYVDRLARNLATARRNFDQELRLRHPLRSPRYGYEAEFIDVNILRFPLSANGPRHGIAYDELSSFARPKDQGRRVKVLVIDVSNDMPPENRTPAHELFNLYQNGYTYFKNRWYTEGTARWAEDFDGRSGTRGAPAWPRSAGDLQELFSKSYETASFWQSVAVKVDPQNRGRAFIRKFLEELDRIDDTVRATDTSKAWKEADQFSKANDAHIWEALRATLRKPEYFSHWDADIRALMEIKR
jgi:hypothetical protein